MIETTKTRAGKIVLSAMEKMHDIMDTYGVTATIKIECAKAIARLAAALETEVQKE